MDQTTEILRLANLHCKAAGLSRATIATQVMNDGKFFDRIEAGGGFTIKTYQKIKDWFKAHSDVSERKSALTEEIRERN